MRRKTLGIAGVVIFPSLVLGFAFSGGVLNFLSNGSLQALPTAKSIEDFTRDSALPNALSASANLNVPFQPQAPFGKWVLPYKEACEEASIIMVNAFFKNTPLTAEMMDSEIVKMVEWEMKTFGHHEDTNAEEIARTLKEYFGHKDVEVLYEYTLDDIKKAVSKGYPIIMTLAGRELNNPFFMPPGPIYHALVIKGYIGSDFITNDPGTKHGRDYLYDAQILINANHERNSPDVDISQGSHAIVIIKQ